MSWSNGLAEWTEGDTAFLSVVFSWRLPEVYQRAIWYHSQGFKVRAGGPAIWANRKYASILSDICEIGGEMEALPHHNPLATIASRGCPVGCYFCLVPTMEGKQFTLLPDFEPRPILCDNNLSALPEDYQKFVIWKYKKAEVPLLDANSGFEPRTFDSGTYARWKEINRGAWRFAFDEIKEGQEVYNMMRVLKDESPRKKRVYVLIGNEPIASCYERVLRVIEWGGEPYCQPLLPLNAERRDAYRILYDWSAIRLMDFARWANRYLWRHTPLNEYNNRKNQKPIFAGLI